MFHQALGMRIDLALASGPVADRVRAAWVDREARKGTGPSDHAPVIVDLDNAPDGDIGPVVPPPSARPARRGPVKLPQAPGPQQEGEASAGSRTIGGTVRYGAGIGSPGPAEPNRGSSHARSLAGTRVRAKMR